MTRARTIGTIVAAFMVAQILAVAIHGFILAADYEPLEGTLLRSVTGGTPPWQMLFLPLVHLSGVVTLVWVYGRLRLAGSVWSRGLVLGMVGYGLGQLPLWLLWYAQQPWPGAIVWKQLVLELVSSIAIGLTIASVAPVPVAVERRAA